MFQTYKNLFNVYLTFSNVLKRYKRIKTCQTFKNLLNTFDPFVFLFLRGWRHSVD